MNKLIKVSSNLIHSPDFISVEEIKYSMSDKDKENVEKYRRIIKEHSDIYFIIIIFQGQVEISTMLDIRLEHTCYFYIDSNTLYVRCYTKYDGQSYIQFEITDYGREEQSNT